MSVRAENSTVDICEVTGKRKFRSKAKAMVHCNRVARINRQNGDRFPVHVYPCDECSGFHIGHDRGFQLRTFARIKGAR